MTHDHGLGQGRIIRRESSSTAAGTDVTAILRAAARRGIELWNLWEMHLKPEPPDRGLLLGYGNIKDTVIDEAVAALAEIIRGGDELGRPGASNEYDRT